MKTIREIAEAVYQEYYVKYNSNITILTSKNKRESRKKIADISSRKF